MYQINITLRTHVMIFLDIFLSVTANNHDIAKHLKALNPVMIGVVADESCCLIRVVVRA